jgi:UPF0271 protein
MEIDLNADLGEGAGNDRLLMPYLSSCNIACGEHAGDAETINETIHLAIRHKVKIGAHPSFPDRKNFGRVVMQLTANELKKSIIDQIKLIKDLVEKAGGTLHHVKPHGALYNQSAVEEDIAKTVIRAICEFDSLSLYAQGGSVIAHLAKDEQIPVKYEVFADRNYHDDLSLISRLEDEAVLSDPDAVTTHVLRMIIDGNVKTLSGKEVPIPADTVCIHGDNPNAVDIIKALHLKLKEANIKVM